MLTDGLIANSAFLSAALSKNWIGFEKNDFEMQITKKDTVSITEVAIRFLDAEQMWIFKPDSVVFTFKLSDGKTKSDLRVNIKEEKRKTGGSVFIYSSKIPANTKSISIKAFNRGLCPAGHPGEGKPAWIFTDEVIGY